MKTKTDPRHKKRVESMKSLFSYSFDSTPQDPESITSIIDNIENIDARIQQAAPEWPLDQINKVDLAILRLSVNELLEGKTPYKVIIDEAVEIAKEYGSENSAKFVNGVLGSILDTIKAESPSPS